MGNICFEVFCESACEPFENLVDNEQCWLKMTDFNAKMRKIDNFLRPINAEPCAVLPLMRVVPTHSWIGAARWKNKYTSSCRCSQDEQQKATGIHVSLD